MIKWYSDYSQQSKERNCSLSRTKDLEKVKLKENSFDPTSSIKMHGSELMWRNGHQMKAATAGSCPEWGEIKSSENLIATYNFKGQICHIRTDNATWDTLLLPTMCQ